MPSLHRLFLSLSHTTHSPLDEPPLRQLQKWVMPWRLHSRHPSRQLLAGPRARIAHPEPGPGPWPRDDVDVTPQPLHGRASALPQASMAWDGATSPSPLSHSMSLTAERYPARLYRRIGLIDTHTSPASDRPPISWLDLSSRTSTPGRQPTERASNEPIKPAPRSQKIRPHVDMYAEAVSVSLLSGTCSFGQRKKARSGVSSGIPDSRLLPRHPS